MQGRAMDIASIRAQTSGGRLGITSASFKFPALLKPDGPGDDSSRPPVW